MLSSAVPTPDAPDVSAVFPVFDPATGREVGVAPDRTLAEAEEVVRAAAAAFPAWSASLAKSRAAHLRRWHDALAADATRIAELITLEQGKPLAEARGEVALSLIHI